MLLLDEYFARSTWNRVPEFRTYVGKIPDLVLETFVLRDGLRTRIFVPRVFVEFKTAINNTDAIQQLLDSIILEYGPNLKSKGFLIGVKGTQFTILDYHLVQTDSGPEPNCYILNFYDDRGDNASQSGRPTPSRQYKDLDFMDLKSRDEGLDIMKALEWIGTVKEARDLTFMNPQARPLAISLTMSTLPSLGSGSEEEQAEEIVNELGSEYAYLIPFLQGEEEEEEDYMETDS